MRVLNFISTALKKSEHHQLQKSLDWLDYAFFELKDVWKIKLPAIYQAIGRKGKIG